jgi:Rieske Fe-S protein
VSELDRRALLRGAGAVGASAAALPLLSACGGGSGNGATPATVSVPASSVPVGGGLIQSKVVVTQPAEGTFKAFSAVCPHQGCSVDSVRDDVISCPCHGSTFSASDGARLSGPAPSGLEVLIASVDGADVVVTV